MAGKVLSIEITTHFIRAVEMDYLSKKPKVYKSFVIPTPIGYYVDGTVLANTDLINSIAAAIAKNKITTKKVLFISLSSRIATREVLIPPLKIKKIPDFIQANATEYFPVDISTYEIAHVILGDVTEAGSTKHKVQVYAVPNDIIVAYRELAYKLRLKFTGFDYVGNSIYQMAKNHFNEGVQVFAKIETTGTQVLITKDGSLELQRTIPHGVNDLLEVLIESNSLPMVNDTVDAKKYFTQNDIIYDESNESLISVAERDRIDDNLKKLSGSISRVIDYYSNNNKGIDITVVNVLGSGACVKGIDKLLSYELNRTVHCLDKVKGLTIDTSEGIEQYISCVGGAMNPVIFAENIKNSVEAEEDELRSTEVVFSVMVVVALILILGSSSLYVYSKVMINSLNSELDSLSEAQTVYDNYLETNSKYAEMIVIEDNMYSVNEMLVDIFSEMESTLPATVRISSISTENNQLTMTLTVTGKESAAKTLVQLRKMSALTAIETAGVTKVDSSGDVEMTITAAMVSVE